MTRENQEIIDALNRAFDMELSDQSVDWKGMFKIFPQLPEGRSFWAEQVALGRMQPYHALWAYREANGRSSEWLAVRISTAATDSFSFSLRPKAQTFLFNLRSERDRRILKKLQEEFRDHILPTIKNSIAREILK